VRGFSSAIAPAKKPRRKINELLNSERCVVLNNLKTIEKQNGRGWAQTYRFNIYRVHFLKILQLISNIRIEDTADEAIYLRKVWQNCKQRDSVSDKDCAQMKHKIKN